MGGRVEAEAFLLINSSDTPLVFETADRKGAGTSRFSLFKNTQSQLIQTPIVMNAAIKSAEAQAVLPKEGVENPLNWLSDRVAITFPNDGEIMRLSLRAPEGKSAVVLLDAVVQAYLQEAVLSERNARMSRLGSLEEVHADAEGKARGKRANLRELVDTLGTGDTKTLSLAQQSSVERYSVMRQELSRVTFELMRAEGELEILKRSLANSAAAAPVEEPASDHLLQPAIHQVDLEKANAADPQMAALRANHIQLAGKISQIQRQLTPDKAGPRVKELERELEQVEQEMESRGRVLHDYLLHQARQGQSGVAGGTNGMDLASKIEALKLKANVFKSQKEQLESEVADAEETSKSIGRSSIDVEMMRAEIASYEEVRARLGEEIERTRIELNAEPRIRLLSSAALSSNSDGKKRIAAAGAVGFAGLCLPFILLIALDMKRGTIGDSTIVKNALNVEILGSVSRYKGKLPANINYDQAKLRRDLAVHMESVHSVAATILRNRSLDGNAVVMVTSAEHGEGKSSLAQGLWYSLCHSGHPTILVDMDLCRPSVHKKLSVDREPGFVEYLAGELPLEDIIRTDSQGRRFITAGRPVGNRLSYLSGGALSQAIGDLRLEAEFIIVDSAPLLPVADSRVLLECVDSCVLAAIKDQSRLPQLQAAFELTRFHGVGVAGVVLMGETRIGSKYPYA
jgi:Mrp family chromosome partitioning ATPase